MGLRAADGSCHRFRERRHRKDRSEPDETGRVDLQQGFPTHTHAAFLGEALAGMARFRVHGREGARIQMTFIQRDAALFDDDRRDAGFGDT